MNAIFEESGMKRLVGSVVGLGLVAMSCALAVAWPGSPASAQAAPTDCSDRYDGIDVGFVVDRSGSMGWNDPSNERVAAVKTFIDAMRSQDKGVVIPFEDTLPSTRPLIALDTSANRTTLKAQADSAAGAGGNTAIDLGYLAAKASLGSPVAGRGRIVIILTDGEGSGMTATQIGQDAASSEIAAYTIGLGSPDAAFLQEIAAQSGGTYSHISTASDLHALYQSIAGDVQDPNCDRVGSVTNGGSHGDPVDVATGNFYVDESDLVPPSGVTALATLNRRHNSLGAASGQFGPRWLGSFDTRVTFAPDGGRGLYDSNGDVALYVASGGGWTRPNAAYGELSFTSGEYTLKRTNGVVEKFDSNGWLVRRIDPSGQTVTITRSAEGYISSVGAGPYTITFEDTRRIALGVEVAGADGLVDRAVTSDGRVVRYTYAADSVTGRTVLAKASMPHTVAEDTMVPAPYGDHRYVTSNGRMVEMWERVSATQERRLVLNTLGSTGRVVSQVTQDGDTTNFHYGLKPGGGGMLVPADGFTTAVDTASGDVTVYQYDTRGQLLGITDAAGNPISRGYQNDVFATGTSRTSVTTDIAFDAADRPTTVTKSAPGGGTRTVEVLTYVVAATDPAAATDQRLASLTTAGVTTTYTYGDAQNPFLPTKTELPCDAASLTPGLSCPTSGKTATTYTYFTGTKAGLLKDAIDADGVKQSYTYHDDRSIAIITKTPASGVMLVTSHDFFRPGDSGFPTNAPSGTALAERTVSAQGNSTPAAGDGTSWVFEDARGLVLENRDPTWNGTTVTGTRYAYAFDGQLISTTDAADVVTTITVGRPGDAGWSEPANIAEVETQTVGTTIGTYKAQSTVSRFDTSNDLVSVTKGDLADPASLATTSYQYGPLGRLTKETDPTGISQWYHYDNEGRVARLVTGPTDNVADRTTTTSYTPFGEIASVTTPLGTDLDSVQVTSKTCFAYDQYGRQAARIEGCDGPAGNALMTGTVFDAVGRPWRTIGHNDGNTNPAQAASSAPGDEVNETRYTLAGRTGANLTAPVDTPGFNWASGTGKLQTTYTYDGTGRVTKVTMPPLSPGGATREVTRTYDPNGNVATETTPMGKARSYTYDGRNQMLSVTMPHGTNPTSPQATVAKRTYDAVGRVTTETDPHLPTTTNPPTRYYEYNPAGNVTIVTDPLSNKVSYRYDGRGNSTEQRYGGTNGDTTVAESRTYNLANQVTAETKQSPESWPGNKTTTFEYDSNFGFLNKTIDPTSNTETRSYYLDGTLKQRQWTRAFATTITTAVSVNNRGWRTKMRDQTGSTVLTTTYGYNRAGNPLTVAAPSGTLTYTWDLHRNPTTLTYPDGATGTYLHTSTGEIRDITVRSGPGQPDLPWANYNFDNDGNRTSEWMYSAGGNSRYWDRDAAGNIKTYTTAVKRPDNSFDIYTEGRVYRPDGRIESSTVNGAAKTFTYDTAGQLTAETGTNAATYTYNSRGSRLTKASAAGTTIYDYFTAGNVKRATAPGGDITTYLYDAAGRQSQAKTVNGTTTVNQRDVSYNTRGLARAITETTSAYAGVETDRIYDGDGLLAKTSMAEDGATALPVDLLWDKTNSVPQAVDLNIAGVARARSDFAQNRVSYKISSEFFTQWFKYDANDSPIASTGNSNIVSATTGYDAYGNPNEKIQYSTFGYHGELQFGTTLYLRNRTYDPNTGQFLTRDPLPGVTGTTTATNNFHYTNNDPLNMTDPLGLRPGDGAITDGQIGAACDSVGGRIVWWGDTGSRVCMEPPVGRIEGGECFPPYTPGGDAIVFHNGACSVLTTEIVCDRGAFIPGLNRICRNSDAIITGLTVIAVVAGSVATGGALAAALVEIGGGTGVMLGGGAAALAGGGSTGGGIVVSATLAESLAQAGLGAGILGLVNMAQSNGRPGSVPNRAHQQKEFEDAWKECQRRIGRRGRPERRILHDAITGQGLGYHEIVAECVGLFG